MLILAVLILVVLILAVLILVVLILYDPFQLVVQELGLFQGYSQDDADTQMMVLDVAAVVHTTAAAAVEAVVGVEAAASYLELSYF